MKKVFESIGTEISTLEKNFEFICSRNNEKDIYVLCDLRSAIAKLRKDLDLQLYKLAIFKTSNDCLSYYYKFEVNDEFLDERNAVLEHIDYVVKNYDSSERNSFSKNSNKLNGENLSVFVKDLNKYKTILDDLEKKVNEKINKKVNKR